MKSKDQKVKPAAICRVGVHFTEEQKRLIKKYVRMGNFFYRFCYRIGNFFTRKAQKRILDKTEGSGGKDGDN